MSSGVGQNRIEAPHPLERVTRRGEGEIRAEQDFVFGVIFDQQAHRVVELPGPIIERGKVGEDAGVAPNDRDGLAFPRVAEVSEHQLEVGKVDGHLVPVRGARVFQRDVARRRRPTTRD